MKKRILVALVGCGLLAFNTVEAAEKSMFDGSKAFSKCMLTDEMLYSDDNDFSMGPNRTVQEIREILDNQIIYLGERCGVTLANEVSRIGFSLTELRKYVDSLSDDYIISILKFRIKLVGDLLIKTEIEKVKDLDRKKSDKKEDSDDSDLSWDDPTNDLYWDEW